MSAAGFDLSSANVAVTVCADVCEYKALSATSVPHTEKLREKISQSLDSIRFDQCIETKTAKRTSAVSSVCCHMSECIWCK